MEVVNEKVKFGGLVTRALPGAMNIEALITTIQRRMFKEKDMSDKEIDKLIRKLDDKIDTVNEMVNINNRPGYQPLAVTLVGQLDNVGGKKTLKNLKEIRAKLIAMKKHKAKPVKECRIDLDKVLKHPGSTDDDIMIAIETFVLSVGESYRVCRDKTDLNSKVELNNILKECAIPKIELKLHDSFNDRGYFLKDESIEYAIETAISLNERIKDIDDELREESVNEEYTITVECDLNPIRTFCNNLIDDILTESVNDFNIGDYKKCGVEILKESAEVLENEFFKPLGARLGESELETNLLKVLECVNSLDKCITDPTKLIPLREAVKYFNDESHSIQDAIVIEGLDAELDLLLPEKHTVSIRRDACGINQIDSVLEQVNCSLMSGNIKTGGDKIFLESRLDSKIHELEMYDALAIRTTGLDRITRENLEILAEAKSRVQNVPVSKSKDRSENLTVSGISKFALAVDKRIAAGNIKTVGDKKELCFLIEKRLKRLESNKTPEAKKVYNKLKSTKMNIDKIKVVRESRVLGDASLKVNPEYRYGMDLVVREGMDRGTLKLRAMEARNSGDRDRLIKVLETTLRQVADIDDKAEYKKYLDYVVKTPNIMSENFNSYDKSFFNKELSVSLESYVSGYLGRPITAGFVTSKNCSSAACDFVKEKGIQEILNGINIAASGIVY